MRVVPEGEIWWLRECDIVITSSSSSLISISLSLNPAQTLHINGHLIWVSESLPYSSVYTTRLFKCMYDQLYLIFPPWGNNLRFMLQISVYYLWILVHVQLTQPRIITTQTQDTVMCSHIQDVRVMLIDSLTSLNV